MSEPIMIGPRRVEAEDAFTTKDGYPVASIMRNEQYGDSGVASTKQWLQLPPNGGCCVGFDEAVAFHKWLGERIEKEQP